MANTKEMLDKLRFCINCNSQCVALVEWDALPSCPEWPEHWIVTRYCHECEIFITDVYSQAEVELYDEWLDDEADQLQRMSKKFEHSNMKDWAAQFIVLLDRDIIVPEDF